MTDDPTLREKLRARPVDGIVNLAGYDPAITPFVESKDDAEDELYGDFADQLFDLHELVFANEDRSILLVLQGIDCSGKNGTIKHVVISMNPAGVRTESFVEPTEEEREQHFLQRYREVAPRAGELVAFDRSHYEDVIVPDATGTLDEEEIAERIEEINAFETELTDSGVVIVKCLLHISFDEQRERFLRRLRRHDKRWKFSEADIDTRKLWNEYQAAYGRAVGATSTDHAPWYVIPADHKWYRNWAVARVLIETMTDLGLDYPEPDLDLPALRARLEPPN